MPPLHEIGRLPAPTDNVAIAIRRLDAGTEIEHGSRRFSLSHTILEGHRFAVAAIDPGGYLYSWQMPFGTAIRRLEPGDYACNEGVLDALRGRDIDFELPGAPNFSDDIPAYVFDAGQFSPGEKTREIKDELVFEGFDRGRRGVGTRNYIAVMAASSRASAFVRRLAASCNDFAADFPNIDGIVPVAHTEGDDERQFNEELVIRTLAGFFVHPNLGAVLVVDAPGAAVTGDKIKRYLAEREYPYEDIASAFFTLDGNIEQVLADAQSEIVSWLSAVNRAERRRQSIRHLNLSLQCGGSDAFSGISGNPLAAWAARAIVQRSGKANLAETDELIGAESYVLQRVKDRATAERFLYVKQRFVDTAARHGSSAAGNPSGGNKYRGLYNIYLKSLGAAMKRNPEVRLDDVIEYGEPMREPGYYFMDSPGNDLESIAGQVASGGNIIYFVTGNGSITNFPFVPTVKIVTTTQRYELLKGEMDVNAGAYLDGVSMDALGEDLLRCTLEVASGERTAGERAGHAQVQLWRNWRIGAAEQAMDDPGSRRFSGRPIPIALDAAPEIAAPGADEDRPSFGLVLPTSLCSAQIAQMAADRLNERGVAGRLGLKKIVSLVHTEGCGVSSGSAEDLFVRTMVAYVAHPAVRHAFLLEHGCEKTHNDFFLRYLERNGMDAGRFGWASIQRDGGIDRVLDLIEAWFNDRTVAGNVRHHTTPAVGFVFVAEPGAEAAAALSGVIAAIVREGGSGVVAQPAGHDMASRIYRLLGIGDSPEATLNYGQAMDETGFHIMAAPSNHVQETVAGLGATGVDVIVVVGGREMAAGHPFIPVVQIGLNPDVRADITLNGGKADAERVAILIYDAASGAYTPQAARFDLVDFQMSRGWSGVSL